MTLSLAQIKDAVADWPTAERAELAEFLLHSLDDRPDAAVRSEWLALAAQRLAAVRAGTVAGSPAEQVLRGLLEPAS
jgi:hypothetical protein